MMDQEERHGHVTLVPAQPRPGGHERRIWKVMIEGRQHGWIVRPHGIGADHEAWSMHWMPRGGATVGKVGLLGKSRQPEGPDAERRDLAQRFEAAFERGKVPTAEEIAASGGPPRQARRTRREPSMREALGEIRVTDARPARVDEDGNALPGIGYIP